MYMYLLHTTCMYVYMYVHTYSYTLNPVDFETGVLRRLRPDSLGKNSMDYYYFCLNCG